MSVGDKNICVKVSAPGKVILHGEHSVVYGKLAIAASLDLRTKVTIEENSSGKLEFHFTDVGVSKEFKIEELQSIYDSTKIPLKPNIPKYDWTNPETINHEAYIDFIINSFKLENLEQNVRSCTILFFYVYFGIVATNAIKVDGLSVTVQSDLKIGAGMGSSASFMVALSGAFIRYLKLKKVTEGSTEVSKEFSHSELNLISSWAFAGEKFMHGKPSGMDNTICTFGSMVSFRKARSEAEQNQFKQVKTSPNLQCLLIDTNVPKNTLEQVAKVKRLYEKYPKIVDSIFNGIEEITLEALDNLENLAWLEKFEDIQKCYTNLMDMADLNHNLLKSLGVSHPALEDVMSILSKRNLHGKLTGAGGGGYALALIPISYNFEDIDLTIQELVQKGYRPIVCKLGSSGITIDT